MRGLAEDLRKILRALRMTLLRRDRLWREPSGPVALLDPYLGDDAEPPTLPELAALLDRFRLGFGGLERIGLSLIERRTYFIGPSEYPAALLVDRLDLGLRALRLERGLTIGETAAAAGLKPHGLSAIETIGRREKPTLAVLDRLLQALDSSYQELERVVGNPFRVADKLARRLRKAERWAEPVILDGRVLPDTVVDRLDLALLSLRLQAGWSRPALAAAAEVPVERVQAFEQSDRRARPSQAELVALLAALDVSAEALEQAATHPLRGIPDLTSERKPWSGAHTRKRCRRRARASARPSRLLSSAWRVERSLSELRASVAASSSGLPGTVEDDTQ